ncbi:MAG: hypothetical protein HKO93_00375 [Flavobacteriales bacterium]|nr:hypothetical protein [Flavobacteriales bacterium]
MKKVFVNIIALLVISGYMNAQELEESFLELDGELRPSIGLKINIPVDAAKDALVDFMKDNYDFKVKGNGFLANKSTLRAEEVNYFITEENPVNLYFNFSQFDEVTEMKIVARDSIQYYLAEDYRPAHFNKLKDIMLNYRVNAEEDYFNQQLEEQNKSLKRVKKNLASAQKDIKKNNDDIEKNLDENEKMKKENVDLENDISEYKKRIEDLKQKIANSRSELKE